MDVKIKGWPMGDPDHFPGRRVHISGLDDYTGKTFEVAVWFDLDPQRGVVIRRIDADEITSNFVRLIPFDKVRRVIFESISSNPDLLSPAALVGQLIEAGHGEAAPEELAYMSKAREAVEEAVEELKEGHPNLGRAANNDRRNAQIAAMYLQYHVTYGQKCVRAMAQELETEPKQVSNWVSQARGGGWLSKAPGPGQAGGTAGWRLVKWLEEHEEEQA